LSDFLNEYKEDFIIAKNKAERLQDLADAEQLEFIKKKAEWMMKG